MKNYSLVILLLSILGPFQSVFASSEAVSTPKDVSVLIYYSGDNRLSDFMHSSYLRVLREGAGPHVNVVVQYDGSEKNDSFRVAIGDTKVGNEIQQTFYEKNVEYDMGNTKTLVDFVKWGKAKFPAKRTFLVISSHGFGILNNPYPDFKNQSSDSKISNLASSIDESSHTFMMEEKMVAQLRQALGGQKLDLLVHNSCLMGSLESLSVMASIAKYAITSEYSIFMNKNDDLTNDEARTILIERIIRQIKANPEVSEQEIGKKVVTDFGINYKNFQMPTTDTDDIIRFPSTLAFYDLSQIHKLANMYSNAGKIFMALAKKDSRVFNRLIDENLKTLYVDSFGYIDLRALYNMLTGAIDPEKRAESMQVFDKVANLVVPEKVELYTGQRLPVAHLHVFFPSFITQADLRPFRKSYSKISTVQYYGWPQFLDFVWTQYDNMSGQYWTDKLIQWDSGQSIRVKTTSPQDSLDDDFFLQLFMVALKMSHAPGKEKLKEYSKVLNSLKRHDPILEKHKIEVQNLLK